MRCRSHHIALFSLDRFELRLYFRNHKLRLLFCEILLVEAKKVSLNIILKGKTSLAFAFYTHWPGFIRYCKTNHDFVNREGAQVQVQANLTAIAVALTNKYLHVIDRFTKISR